MGYEKWWVYTVQKNYQQELNDNNHLSEYIIYSIQVSDCLENGDEENYSKMCEEETQFLDLINSSEWTIKNEFGKSFKILCPIFHSNNQITWQRDYE